MFRRPLILAVLESLLRLVLIVAVSVCATYLLLNCAGCAAPPGEVSEALRIDDDSSPDAEADTGGERGPDSDGAAEALEETRSDSLGDSRTEESGLDSAVSTEVSDGAPDGGASDTTPPPDSSVDVRPEVPIDTAPACPSGRWCWSGAATATRLDGAPCAGEGDTVCCSGYCLDGYCAPYATAPGWCGEPGYYCPGEGKCAP